METDDLLQVRTNKLWSSVMMGRLQSESLWRTLGQLNLSSASSIRVLFVGPQYASSAVKIILLWKNVFIQLQMCTSTCKSDNSHKYRMSRVLLRRTSVTRQRRMFAKFTIIPYLGYFVSWIALLSLHTRTSGYKWTYTVSVLGKEYVKIAFCSFCL